jgi:hypothetical protein
LLKKWGALFPTYFTFVMATGIVAIAANDIGYRVLGRVMCGINLLAGAVICGSGGVRLAREPGGGLAGTAAS